MATIPPSNPQPTANDTDRQDERRRAPRSGLSVPCCLRAEGRLRSSVGRTRNVSRTGALVQLAPGAPELKTGDEIRVALVPPATGLVDAGELKPARVVRVSDSTRGSSCVALTWAEQAVPSLVLRAVASPIEAPAEAA